GKSDSRQGGRGERRRDWIERATAFDVEADAALRAGARQARAADPRSDRRRGNQSSLRSPSVVRGGRACVRIGRVLLQGRVRGTRDDGRAPGSAGARQIRGQESRGSAKRRLPPYHRWEGYRGGGCRRRAKRRRV